MLGPYRDLTTIDFQKPLNTGIRIIIDYYMPNDQTLIRFDIKIGNRQYNSVIFCGDPKVPTSGLINKTDDMLTPKSGITNCINQKANKEEILRALKELVNDIENDKDE